MCGSCTEWPVTPGCSPMSEVRISLALLILMLAGVETLADETTPVFEPGAKPQLLQTTGAGEGPAWHPQLGLLTSASVSPVFG